jgi:uncharacterized membrane protein
VSPEKETGRLEAFSDGVFAIAMTLLALDLKWPSQHEVISNKALWLKLMAAWPSFLAFSISFGTLLVMWVNHHGIFEHIHKVNRPILFANGFLLMLIVTVPFSTALLTEQFRTPASNTATAVYAGFFALLNIAFLVLWHVASRDRTFLKPGVTQQTVVHLHKALLAGVPAYLIAFIVSFFSTGISLAILTLLWIYWVMQGTPKGNQ